jgi:hypothetical protein
VLASEALARIEAELKRLAQSGAARAELANRLGQEIVAGFGMAAFAVMLLLALLD